MSAVMSTHAESGKVIEITVLHAGKNVFFRFRVTGIDLTGKNFLGNIMYFHCFHLLWQLKLTRLLYYHQEKNAQLYEIM